MLHAGPDALSTAFADAAAIDTRSHARNHRHEVVHQAVPRIARIDGLYPAALLLPERGDVAIANAREPVPVLHDEHTHLRIDEQFLELRPLIVQARGDLDHLHHHRITPSPPIRAQTLHLAHSIVLLVS